MIALTAIQRETLAFIIETIAECGYPPTIRELCGRFGISINAVHDRLRGLRAKRAIEVDPLVSRGIRVRGIRWQPIPTGEDPSAAVYELLAERARAACATEPPHA